MSAPIQLFGPYRARRTRLARLHRALSRWALRHWLGAWLEMALLAVAVAALVAGVPFLAGVLSAYLPGL